jgi:iron-sulfur cluster assembly accessory protein
MLGDLASMVSSLPSARPSDFESVPLHIVRSKTKTAVLRLSKSFPMAATRTRFFSSAAMEADLDMGDDSKQKKKGSRRRVVDSKDPLILTQAAADRIQELLRGENAKGAIGIRLGTKRRGCNGLSYTLNYALEKPEKDVAMESHGVQVFIEPMALFNIVGTVMDWEESELSSEFTFNNPNSKGECGCGESFNV